MQLQTRKSFVVLLHAASSAKVSLNRTKVAKLLYLADLRAVERGGDLFTGYKWRWRHFGPYDNTLLTVEHRLSDKGVIEPIKTENYYGSPEWRIELRQLPPADIDREFWDLIHEVVEEFGHLSASSLRDLTYQTPPMTDAVGDGANEVVLDFSDVRPPPQIATALRRLRDAVQAADSEEDDPGVAEDLVTELSELAPTRARANRELLD